MEIAKYIKKIIYDENDNTIEANIGLPYYYKCIIPGVFLKAKSKKFFKSRESFINKMLVLHNYSLLFYEKEPEEEIPEKIELINIFNAKNAIYRIRTRELTNEISDWLGYGNWSMVFSDTNMVFYSLPRHFEMTNKKILQYEQVEAVINSYFDDWEWHFVAKKDSKIAKLLLKRLDHSNS